MKLIRNPWVVSGAAVLGLVIAACSSKSTDTGGGTAGNTNGGGAGGAGGMGGTAGRTSTAPATGGKVAASSTGGAATSVGGSTGVNSSSYCNGILAGKSCSQTSLQANVRTVNMLIVLDESGSMNDALTTGGATKWAIMQNALNSALSTPTVEQNINFGLLLFPYLAAGITANSSPSDSCNVPSDSTAVSVPITAGATGLQNVLDKIAGQSPGGGTPTAAALTQAYNYFTNGDGRNLTGSKWVLLATDGGPNCNFGLTCTAATCTQNMDGLCGNGPTTTVNCCASPNGYICLDDAAATSEITALNLASINTFVVGVPGSQPYAAVLNSFAKAGGVANTAAGATEEYYEISGTSAAQAEADLIAAFGTITTQLVKTCDIQLARTPLDNTQVNVAIDCALQQPVPVNSPADAGVNGFYIDNTKEPAHLILVGAPCNNILTNGALRVDVIEGCGNGLK